MKIENLMHWQWGSYAQNHATKINLLIHLIAVPAFIIANAWLLYATIRLDVVGVSVSTSAMLVSVGLQGFGHDREPIPPAPFSSVGNAAARIFLEQWITFPRFVASGGWLRSYRDAHR